jgi:formate dehydrogenase maturation protein FdhE
VEIKCQLDATDEFLLQILLLAQLVSNTIMPIIRSSGVLYKWFLHVVFSAWFSSCRYGVELRVVCPVCGQQPAAAIKTHLLHLVGILFTHNYFD